MHGLAVGEGVCTVCCSVQPSKSENMIPAWYGKCSKSKKHTHTYYIQHTHDFRECENSQTKTPVCEMQYFRKRVLLLLVCIFVSKCGDVFEYGAYLCQPMLYVCACAWCRYEYKIFFSFFIFALHCTHCAHMWEECMEHGNVLFVAVAATPHCVLHKIKCEINANDKWESEGIIQQFHVIYNRLAFLLLVFLYLGRFVSAMICLKEWLFFANSFAYINDNSVLHVYFLFFQVLHCK